MKLFFDAFSRAAMGATSLLPLIGLFLLGNFATAEKVQCLSGNITQKQFTLSVHRKLVGMFLYERCHNKNPCTTFYVDVHIDAKYSMNKMVLSGLALIKS